MGRLSWRILISLGLLGSLTGGFWVKTTSAAIKSAEKTEAYDVEICNHSKQEVLFASIAYFDDGINTWVQKGWYAIPKDQCSVTLKNLKPPLYAYAETSTPQMKWAGHRDDDRGFCVHKSDKFAIRQTNCAPLIAESSDQVRRQAFTPLQVSGQGGVFRWDLVE